MTSRPKSKLIRCGASGRPLPVRSPLSAAHGFPTAASRGRTAPSRGRPQRPVGGRPQEIAVSSPGTGTRALDQPRLVPPHDAPGGVGRHQTRAAPVARALLAPPSSSPILPAAGRHQGGQQAAGAAARAQLDGEAVRPRQQQVADLVHVERRACLVAVRADALAVEPHHVLLVGRHPQLGRRGRRNLPIRRHLEVPHRIEGERRRQPLRQRGPDPLRLPGHQLRRPHPPPPRRHHRRHRHGSHGDENDDNKRGTAHAVDCTRPTLARPPNPFSKKQSSLDVNQGPALHGVGLTGVGLTEGRGGRQPAKTRGRAVPRPPTPVGRSASR